MKISAATVLCLALLAQARADEVDDMIAAGIATLQGYAKATELYIKDAQDLVPQTIAYFDHSIEVFTAEALDVLTVSQTLVNETAMNLTHDAIINNKPGSVLTCIANHQNTAVTQSSQAIVKLEGDFEAAASKHDARFSDLANQLGLIASVLPNIYAQHEPNLLTCVNQECIDNNLAVAKTAYDNLVTNVDKELSAIKTIRAEFNQKTINLLFDYRKSVSDTETTQLKKMKNC